VTGQIWSMCNCPECKLTQYTFTMGDYNTVYRICGCADVPVIMLGEKIVCIVAPQSNNSNNMQSPETPCPTSDISLPDEVLPEVCEVGARGRDNSASKNQNKIKETTKC
jgi:hypothetical protein